MPDEDGDRIQELLHTALYDTGGESVEGAFVDHWESFAWRALDELKALFRESGYTPEDESRIRVALQQPDVPAEAGGALLASLSDYTGPLVEALRTDPSPSARAAAVLASPKFQAHEAVRDALRDPEPLVRHAAIAALAAHMRQFPQGKQDLIRALDDPEASVRRLAAEKIGIVRDLPAGEALARRLRIEPDADVRRAILQNIAATVRSEGVSRGGQAVLERVGEPIRRALIDALDYPEPKVRIDAARALERMPGVEVSEAILRRYEVEPDVMARRMLGYYPALNLIREKAFPVLARLLKEDPDLGVRNCIAETLACFGPEAAPALTEAALDPTGPRGPAALSLAVVAKLDAFSVLAQQYAATADEPARSDLRRALRDLQYQMPDEPAPPTAELSARIAARVAALQPAALGDWVRRLCKEQGVLPLHSTALDTWALRPDGVVVVCDHDSSRQTPEPENDAFMRFATLAAGAVAYPELTPLLSRPSAPVSPCRECRTRSYVTNSSGEAESCYDCGGMGWTRDRV